MTHVNEPGNPVALQLSSLLFLTYQMLRWAILLFSLLLTCSKICGTACWPLCDVEVKCKLVAQVMAFHGHTLKKILNKTINFRVKEEAERSTLHRFVIFIFYT